MGAALATGALTVVAVRDRSLESTGPLLSVLGFLVSLAGLLLSTARTGPSPSPGELLDRAAGTLAEAVRAQWQAEWRLRRLQDPEPLAVRWVAASAWLSDLEEAIGWPARDGQRPDLDGQITDIAHVFGRVPSRRLVVLGAPGSGKTVLAVRFTLDLLSRQRTGDPVPVIFQVSTWHPDQQGLRQWLADQLVIGYPTLAADGPSGDVLARELVATGRVLPVLDGLDEMAAPTRSAAVWRLNTELDAGSPLLLTCRSNVYAEVVQNSDVLTSAAVVELQPLGFEEAAEFLVRTARPVRDPAGTRATAWDPILDHVRRHPDTPTSRRLREILSLPLMVAMARAAYGDTGADPSELLCNPRFATPAVLQQHLLEAFVPASFRTSARWDSDDAVHWLRFLARHLEQRGTRDLAWWELPEAQPAPLRLLGPLLGLGILIEAICVARWLSGHGAASTVAAGAGLLGLCVGYAVLSREGIRLRYKALLPLIGVIPLAARIGWVQPLFVSQGEWITRGTGAAYGIGPVLDRLTVGALYGLAVASGLAVVGVTTTPTPSTMPFGWRRRQQRASAQPWRLGRALGQGLSVGLLAGTVLGLGFALAAGSTAAGRAAAFSEDNRWQWLAEGQSPGELFRSAVAFGVTGGLGLGLVAGFSAGLHRWLGVPVDTSRTSSPLDSLRSDRATGLIRGFLVLNSALLSAGLADFVLPQGAGIATAVCLPIGPIALVVSAWGRLLIARLWLCGAGRLPWRLMAFLAEAHERGVLRQAGSVYQFRHARLQEQLASDRTGESA
ncbi:hypothetical protein GCM10011579_079010 [Streptomyces albiflavescens]|uniref:NACHT domain-containing protein n=1 Tax=Streptomyces albiflavescens TaxID=1623582 RepID=A0A918D8W9_9ACTN|nr:NACHT domain-containing protein [Streptomyces albiflavescens]GGN86812.1 hypothetical protein GCM10011579_079010 [Streptomyces albiflavescens]